MVLQVKELLAEGGFGKVNAKAVCEQMCILEGWDHAVIDKEDPYQEHQKLDLIEWPSCIEPPESEAPFNHDKVSVHAEDSVVGVAWKSCTTAIGGWPGAATTLNSKWLAKNTKKCGCTSACPPCTGLSGDSASLLPGFDVTAQNVEGSFSSISSMRANRLRASAAAWPNAGFGCFASSLETFFIHIISMVQVRGQGFAVCDVQKFLETTEGSSIYAGDDATACVLKIPAGCVVWIPYGYMPLPLGMGYNQKEKDKFFHVHVLTVFDDRMFMALPHEIRHIVFTLNNDYLVGQNSGDFQKRLGQLKTVCKRGGVDVDVK